MEILDRGDRGAGIGLRRGGMYDHLTLISGRGHPELAQEISEYLGLSLGAVQVSDFPDGEISVQLDHNIRGCDVFLIQPTCAPVNDHLMELLIMVDACRRASARQIRACKTVLFGWLCKVKAF